MASTWRTYPAAQPGANSAWPENFTWLARVEPRSCTYVFVSLPSSQNMICWPTHPEIVSETLRLPLRAVVASSSAMRSSRSAQHSPPRSAVLATVDAEQTITPAARNRVQLNTRFIAGPFVICRSRPTDFVCTLAASPMISPPTFF
jgi:hypothetical protein